MFKKLIAFITENVKEGYEEAKAERDAKNEKERLQAEENNKIIEGIPAEEKFALAIAAPFRAVYLAAWSPILEKTDDGKKPFVLYSFGKPESLPDENRATLRDLLFRDFRVRDKDSAIKVIASLFMAASISPSLAEYADDDFVTSAEGVRAVIELLHGEASADGSAAVLLSPYWALAACMAAYVISGSADLAYLERDFALKLLIETAAFAKERFTSWEDYGEAFLKGERIAKLNNALGHNILKKYVGYLNTKFGSPWRVVAWE